MQQYNHCSNKSIFSILKEGKFALNIRFILKKIDDNRMRILKLVAVRKFKSNLKIVIVKARN